MIEMKYCTKGMKQKAEIMERKGYRHHTIAVLSVIVVMFVTVSLTAYGKDIDPQTAITTQKRRREALTEQSKILIIYSMTHGDAALSSSLATMRWAKCWPTAQKEHLIR